LDKITILEIKFAQLTLPSAVANVRHELELLQKIAVQAPDPEGRLAVLKPALKAINQRLWVVENQIRAKEASKHFDPEFVELARSIYRLNDERGRLKYEINLLLKSDLIEEKQYASY
jgi:Family of unknown function (DUF6165)